VLIAKQSDQPGMATPGFRRTEPGSNTALQRKPKSPWERLSGRITKKPEEMPMAKIVIIGAGIGGIPMAFEMNRSAAF